VVWGNAKNGNSASPKDSAGKALGVVYVPLSIFVPPNRGDGLHLVQLEFVSYFFDRLGLNRQLVFNERIHKGMFAKKD